MINEDETSSGSYSDQYIIKDSFVSLLWFRDVNSLLSQVQISMNTIAAVNSTTIGSTNSIRKFKILLGCWFSKENIGKKNETSNNFELKKSFFAAFFILKIKLK